MGQQLKYKGKAMSEGDEKMSSKNKIYKDEINKERALQKVEKYSMRDEEARKKKVEDDVIGLSNRSAQIRGHKPPILPVPTLVLDKVGDLSTPTTVMSLLLLLRLVGPPMTL